MNNNEKPTEAEKQKYYEIVKWAAENHMSVTMHWMNDRSVDQLLTIFERVNREVPIGDLRWSIAHLNDASPETLRRMKTLGMGWTVQDEMYFAGENFVKQRGADAARRVPPVETAKELGVVVGAGTDAHRVASYNPFTALQWFLDGKTVGGKAIRGPEETPSRAEALRLYTMGSAWFSTMKQRRGSLEAGQAGGSRGVIERLHDGAGRPGRRNRVFAHDGWRQGGVRRRPVRSLGNEAVSGGDIF